MYDDYRENREYQEDRARNEIDFLSGRPERNTVIGSDDITNLQIALNTATTIDEFCVVV